jgi:hypothetical protein
MEKPWTHEDWHAASTALGDAEHRHARRAEHPDLTPEAKGREHHRAQAVRKAREHLAATVKLTG